MFGFQAYLGQAVLKGQENYGNTKRGVAGVDQVFYGDWTDSEKVYLQTKNF